MIPADMKFSAFDVPYTQNPWADEIESEWAEIAKRETMAVSHSGKVRSLEKRYENFVDGKILEFWLRLNTKMVKVTKENLQKYCKDHPYLKELLNPKFMKYHDLILPSTGQIVEVKAFHPGYLDWRNNETNYIRKLLKNCYEKQWNFTDVIMLFAHSKAEYEYREVIDVEKVAPKFIF